MNIMTAAGPRDFRTHPVPTHHPAHVARVQDFVRHLTSPTIQGWTRVHKHEADVATELDRQTCPFVQALGDTRGY